MNIDSIRNDVARKVGWNIILFQQLEQLLKLFVSYGSISGHLDQILAHQEKRKDSVAKSTLGMVAGEFLLNPEPPAGPDNVAKPYVSFHYKYEINESLKAEIEELVAQRNRLVHHFLQDTDFTAIESLFEASCFLESQKDRINRVLANLRSLLGEMTEMRKTLASIIDQDWLSAQAKPLAPDP